MLEFIVKETAPNPQHAVIWLHGLGADGGDFVPVIPLLNIQRPTRFVFPHAPIQPVTVNGGMAMRAWYDIYEMTLDRKIDREGIAESDQALEELIQEQEAQGIPRGNIFVIGFSQGGAVALHHLVRANQALAGVIALSTYSPDLDQPLAHTGQTQVPVAIHHGTQDPVVPESLGIRTRDRLTQQGWAPSYQTWNMPHSVLPEQLIQIGEWLNTHSKD